MSFFHKKLKPFDGNSDLQNEYRQHMHDKFSAKKGRCAIYSAVFGLVALGSAYGLLDKSTKIDLEPVGQKAWVENNKNIGLTVLFGVLTLGGGGAAAYTGSKAHRYAKAADTFEDMRVNRFPSDETILKNNLI